MHPLDLAFPIRVFVEIAISHTEYGKIFYLLMFCVIPISHNLAKSNSAPSILLFSAQKFVSFKRNVRWLNKCSKEDRKIL